MTNSQGWGTVQFASVITEAEIRWRDKVLPEIQTSPSLQARVQQDPILREARIVLTADQREDAVAAAERLRSRWFPFHGLNEIGEQRRKWLGDLQEVTAAEAKEQGASEERVKDLLNEQAVWLAVMRSPMKSTAPQVWKQAQKRWIQEYKSDVLTEVKGSAGRRRAAQPAAFEPPSPERFFAETRLLAIESLNTVWLCEKAGTQLSDAQKNVLRLTYVTGLMEDHIADQMGLSIEAVGKLKRNAMAALRTALG
jgi:DNA-directed RNA polymerase specialized sigma24 family protein